MRNCERRDERSYYGFRLQRSTKSGVGHEVRLGFNTMPARHWVGADDGSHSVWNTKKYEHR